MARKRPRGRKVRVDFRPNRQQPGRPDDWTRRFQRDAEQVEDVRLHESVRTKGELSRKRTVILSDAAAPLVDELLWKRGTVTAARGQLCDVDDEQGQAWQCTVRRLLRTLLIAERAPVTVGDAVWFSDHSEKSDGQRAGVIERVGERKTTLARRDRRGREHTLVANADQLLIVTSVAEPRLKPHLIDRYIVAAHKGGLRPVLCINKVDLCATTLNTEPTGAEDDALGLTARPPPLSSPHPQAMADDEPAAALVEESDLAGDDQSPLTIEQVVDEWRRLGYRCLLTSATTGEGLNDLRAELANHMTVLSGQSGVGKSSLLNALQPDLDLAVREVSDETEKGRHTTSHARLLRLDFGGYVVDTPGIRQFALWAVEAGELEAYFVEFAPHLTKCRFGDCSHRYEEGCGVIAAVESGAISPRRYYSYLKMFQEV